MYIYTFGRFPFDLVACSLTKFDVIFSRKKKDVRFGNLPFIELGIQNFVMLRMSSSVKSKAYSIITSIED